MLEVLQSNQTAVRLHVAKGIKQTGILEQIIKLADSHNVEIKHHTRRQLSYISKNSRQDQGVALDLHAPNLGRIESLPRDATQLLALDGITNPQNLGIIIRSVAASPLDGLILPTKGNAPIGPLVYKTSAGTVVKAKIYQSETLESAISFLKQHNFTLYGLSGQGSQPLNFIDVEKHSVFILGNESEGLAPQTEAMCDQLIHIPMANEVDSINVSAAATLVAFRHLF